MKILHINQSDISGGAGIAGYRLHRGLLNEGVKSKILAGRKELDTDDIVVIPRWYREEKILFKLSSLLGLNYINIISSFAVTKHQLYMDAEILNFHNLHSGYFNYLAIPKLTESKPAVWTLHDMWSFTGHCAYSFDCGRWEIGCGSCPYPNTYPNILTDNTKLELRLKEWIYKKSNLTFVAPSKWLTQMASKSMLSQFPIHHIPNGIDTDTYYPLDPLLCKNVLRVPKDKKVILFGSETFTDKRKGGDLLLNALKSLPKRLKAEITLLTFGHGSETITSQLEIPTVSLGYVKNDRLKSLIFSAADLFVLPTRNDNLPLVLQESMACGTPVVSFDVGGVSDLVRHNVTGYLAQPESYEDLCNGIVKLLEDEKLVNEMSKKCREVILEEYSLELQAKRYIDLYKKIL